MKINLDVSRTPNFIDTEITSNDMFNNNRMTERKYHPNSKAVS